MVDHDHAPAQRLDVGHVVAREQHGRAGAPVVAGQELADAPLHGHVDADRRLVQEQHLRLVHQRDRELRLHALAEREVAHRTLQQVRQIEQRDQLVERAPVAPGLDAVDRAVALERVGDRDVPDELVALAHHQRDAAQEVAFARPRLEAEHARAARARIEQAREHLERGRLAGAVRAEEADDFAGRDFEVDRADRDH